MTKSKSSWGGSSGHRIPKELGDRILGLKSNPPEDIDEFEYTYPVGKVAEWLGKSPDGLIAMLEEFDLVKYMDRGTWYEGPAFDFWAFGSLC